MHLESSNLIFSHNENHCDGSETDRLLDKAVGPHVHGYPLNVVSKRLIMCCWTVSIM